MKTSPWQKQKYILSIKVENGVGVNFCLSTHDKIVYHSDLQNIGMKKPNGGGFLLKDSIGKKIYVFGNSKRYGSISKVFHSVVYAILKEKFQGYDIKFTKPPIENEI